MAIPVDKSRTKYINQWLQVEMMYLYTRVKVRVHM